MEMGGFVFSVLEGEGGGGGKSVDRALEGAEKYLRALWSAPYSRGTVSKNAPVENFEGVTVLMYYQVYNALGP